MAMKDADVYKFLEQLETGGETQKAVPQPQADGNRWYWSCESITYGPVSIDELLRRVRSGEIAESHFVFQEGWTQWQSVADVFARPVKAPPSAPEPLPVEPQPRYKYYRRGPAVLGSGGVTALMIAIIVASFFTRSFGPPVSVAVPWLFAIASTTIGGCLLFAFCRPAGMSSSNVVVGPAIGAYLFTAFVGIFLLLLFQEIAKVAVETNSIGGTPRAWPVIIMLKIIGYGYDHALRGTSNPILGFFSMLISVGICEEVVKILPVAYYVKTTPNHQLSFRKVVFVGAMSGLGFGVSEGIFYSLNMYIPMEVPVGLYILRFFSAAWMHAVWTILSSGVLYLNRSTARSDLSASLERSVYTATVYLIAVCFASAAIHSFYNTVPILGVLLSGGGVLFGLSRWTDPDGTAASGTSAIGTTAVPRQRKRQKNSTLVWTLGIGSAGGLGAFALLCCAGVAANSDQGIAQRVQGQWRLVETEGQRVSESLVIVTDFGSDGSTSGRIINFGRNVFACAGQWEIRDGELLLAATVTFSEDASQPKGSPINVHYEIVSLTQNELILRARSDGRVQTWAR